MNRCKRCGRPLKDDRSRRLGFGPTCYERFVQERLHTLGLAGEGDTEDMEQDVFPTTLGKVHISHGGIAVMHSRQYSKLQVRLWLTGRSGKQQNDTSVRARRRDDLVELDSGSNPGRTFLPLAEWQAFADTLPVAVSATSRTTVPHTPRLVQMARDVVAFRRPEPTDDEWEAENTQERNEVNQMFEVDLEFHEIANAYPLMEGQEFDELVEDIREHGQQEPIVLYEGRILDGRNRYRACKEAGVEPHFVQYGGDSPREFVDSMNMFRRHLTPEQIEAARERRRQRAVELRQQGASYRQIGEELGVDPMTARADVQKSIVEGSTMPDTIITTDGRSYPAERPANLTVWIHEPDEDEPEKHILEVPRGMVTDWVRVYQAVADEFPDALVFVGAGGKDAIAALAAGEDAEIAGRVLQQGTGELYEDLVERVHTPGGDVLCLVCGLQEFRDVVRPLLLDTGYTVVTYISQDEELLRLPAVQRAGRRSRPEPAPDPAPAPGQLPSWVTDEAPQAETPPSPAAPARQEVPADYDPAAHALEMAAFHIGQAYNAIQLGLEEADGAFDQAILAYFLEDDVVRRWAIEMYRENAARLCRPEHLGDLRQRLAQVDEPGEVAWRTAVRLYMWDLRDAAKKEAAA